MKRSLLLTIVFVVFALSAIAQKNYVNLNVHIDMHGISEGIEAGRSFGNKFQLSLFQIIKTQTSYEGTGISSSFYGIKPQFRLFDINSLSITSAIYAGIANQYFITVIPEVSFEYQFHNRFSMILNSYFRESNLTISPGLCVRF